MDSDPAGDRISRRRMLKRIGTGAAVVWTAPVLTSIRTPAFAFGSLNSPCDPGQTCQGCDEFRYCHRPSNCGCLPRQPSGECYCGDLKDGYCSSFQTCNIDADCTQGGVCVFSCGCHGGICMYGCRVQAKGRYAGRGARLDGVT